MVVHMTCRRTTPGPHPAMARGAHDANLPPTPDCAALGASVVPPFRGVVPRDLQAIVLCVARTSPAKARNLSERVRNAAATLEHLPDRGRRDLQEILAERLLRR